MRTKKAKSISVLILSLVLVLTACGSKPAGSSTENKRSEERRVGKECRL